MLVAGKELQEREDRPIVMDYDLDDYDYRIFWENREYEQWAEACVLKSLFERVGQTQWLVDLGGGFGRNAVHYRQRADHAVIIDYSLKNLERAAASTLIGEVESGRIFLVRADLYRLPFVDSAFNTGLMVRVLHHLAQVNDALAEIGRIVGQNWILDVPIKHHALARVRGLLDGEIRQLSNWEPKALGSPEEPFVNFHLAAVRHTLADHGWKTTVAASVNNFRRWDQVLPAPTVTTLRPLIYGMEKVAQKVGRGWWGPSQFVWATRREPILQQASNVVRSTTVSKLPWSALTTRMICPNCRNMLEWSDEAASCLTCSRIYPRRGFVWDFVAD